METNLFGNLTWKDFNPSNVYGNLTRDRVIGLTFPRSDSKLGLEPSILSVLPQGDNVEYSFENRRFNDNDVKYYLCSVYISGVQEFIKWAQQHDREKIVVGGYHPTTFPNEFLRYAHKIVKGPCDDFYATIAQQGQIVSGIVSYNNLPRRDVYDINKNQQIIPDKKPQDLVVSINTSMGCSTTPPCDFCASPIMCAKVVSKPLSFVEKELEQIRLLYEHPRYCFIRDENFLMQPDWKDRIKLIHSYLTYTKLYLFASANTLNEERIAFLNDNGVYMICLGLEDPTKEYGKNKKLDEVVALCKKYGVMVYLSFIVNPLEIIGVEKGEAFYSVLMKRIGDLKPEMICGNFLMPFPGTGLWDKYYAFVDRSFYKYYDSKTPFLVANKELQEKMKFFLFWYQWKYYTSDFYQENVRNFFCGDTLHLRFQELEEYFRKLYEAYWNVRT